MAKQISHLFPTSGVCARSLVQKALTGAQALNISSIADLSRFKMLEKCIPGSYYKEALNKGGCDFARAAAGAGIDRIELKRYIVSNCIQLPTNMSELNCTTLITMYGPTLANMKRSFLRQIPNGVLCDAECVTAFKTVKLPVSMKRYLTKKCFSSKVINSAAVDELGSMVTDLPPSKFKQINAADLERNLRSIKDDIKSSNARSRKKKKAIMKELGKKMMQSGKLSSIRESREIMKEMSLKDLKASITDIETDLIQDLDNATQELGFTDSQRKWVMQQLRKQKRASNYTVHEIRERKSLVTGFLRSDIKEMASSQASSEDPQGLEMAKALCEQSNWPLPPLLSINRDMIVGGLEAMNASNPFSLLTEYDVDGLGCQCMMHFKGDELSQMSPGVCSAVCSKIGSCDRFRCLVPRHRRGVLEACFSCMNLTTSLTEADLTSIGPNLLSEFTNTEAQTRLSGDALKLKIFQLKGMCMNKNFRTTIRNILSSAFSNNGSSIDEEMLRQLGAAIMFLPESMQQNLDKAVVSSIAKDIMETIRPTDETAMGLKKCCEKWLTREDRTALRELKHTLKMTIKDAVIWKMQNARRKRSVVTWTCDDIRLVGEAFTTSSDAELQAVPVDEFKECLPDIGNLAMWTNSQKQILLNKTIESYNYTGVCNMTAELLVQLGSIAQAIDESDVQCLPLTDSDLISSLGSLSGWTASMLSTIAGTYLSANQNDSLTNVDVTDVATLGEIICGFNASQLGDLSATVVAGSGAQLGKLEDCSVEQYTALKDRVTDQNAYGNIGNWSAADVVELKNVLIGLEVGDVQHLSVNAIEGLEAEVIAELPGAVLAAFSTDQFNALVSTQVALVTDEQKTHLSAEQNTLLDNIIQGNYDTGDNSGDGGDTPSKAEMVITTLGWVLSTAILLVLLL